MKLEGVKMDRLEIAKQIARENYGDGVEVIMLEGTPTICENKAKRWEFKCFLKSNTAEVEKEFYLNLYELSKAEKLKRSRQAGNIDMDKKPVYEFVDKE